MAAGENKLLWIETPSRKGVLKGENSRIEIRERTIRGRKRRIRGMRPLKEREAQ